MLKNKSKSGQVVQVLPSGKKKPVHRVLGSALPVGKEKIKTTVVKMTQSQFESYIHSRAGAEKESGSQAVSQQALTSRQRAATGPFLAYVNLCKPLLQSKRPDLSLLEVLKELASQWNGMSRVEKQKFAVIAKESEDKQEVSAVSFANPSVSTAEDPNDRHEEGDGEGDCGDGGTLAEDIGEGPSMEGAVFEVWIFTIVKPFHTVLITELPGRRGGVWGRLLSGVGRTRPADGVISRKQHRSDRGSSTNHPTHSLPGEQRQGGTGAGEVAQPERLRKEGAGAAETLRGVGL